MPDFDSSSLFLSVVAGAIGSGMLVFAKNTGRLVPCVAGLGLMVFPYFIPSVVGQLAVCAVFTALPFIFRYA